jgi:alpha-D-ribose 1-methylphosphonate 5-triphosphate diphosphatase
VVGDRLVDDITVVVEAGVITEVTERGSAPAGALDGRRLLLLPGLVDSHSDGLEKEIRPRRTVQFPVDYAVGSFERRLVAAGVTTVFHGLAYQQRPGQGRSLSLAAEIFEAIAGRRRARASVDHCLLYRLDARDPVALEPLLEHLDRPEAHAIPSLLSFEDHTPGQGQYADVARYEAAVDPTQLPAGVTVTEHVAQLVAEADAQAGYAERNRERLTPLARSGRITLLAHDPARVADIELAVTSGARVAEFPVTLAAAEAARRHGLGIVMGAPNALRGLSHSGNASARELVAAGLCDGLASDYMPSAMLAAAFALTRAGLCDLPRAVRLITAGPALLAGLADRGRIAVGARADLVLVDDRGPWPEVVDVRPAG